MFFPKDTEGVTHAHTLSMFKLAKCDKYLVNDPDDPSASILFQ